MMEKYLDPKNDLVFKKIFGEHKHLCMSLLNSMLPFEKGQEIIDLEYLPIELVPELPGYRHSIVDVRCVDNFGRQFLVEMQIRYTKAFNDRVIYNVCKAYSQQLQRNEPFERLKPVYALIFLDTNMNDLPDYYHHYKILDKENPEHQLKGLEFIFIELRKFNPSNIAEKKLHTLWLRFLRDVDEIAKDVTEDLVDDEYINEALSYTEIMAYSEKQLYIYDRLLDIRRSEQMYVHDAREEGMEKGMEKGRAETQKKIALNLLKKGMSAKEVNEFTGLSFEEIDELTLPMFMYDAREEGMKKGKEMSRAETQKNIALNLLKKGMSAKEVNEITGLSVEEIDELQ